VRSPSCLRRPEFDAPSPRGIPQATSGKGRVCKSVCMSWRMRVHGQRRTGLGNPQTKGIGKGEVKEGLGPVVLMVSVLPAGGQWYSLNYGEFGFGTGFSALFAGGEDCLEWIMA